MALFHLHVTQVKRSAGQSIVTSAAYRAGEKLYSEYYGEVSDYTHKGGVVCTDILLPPQAPAEYQDRATLWNAVEKAERGKKAQLAYSFDIALQAEQILCPTAYMYYKYGITHTGLNLNEPYRWSGDTIRVMLENEVYLGNTINMRYSTKSYKDKRRIEHPRDECLVFENTHPALVTKDIWDIVQRVRQNKRRRNNFDEQDKYTGLLVCADCGNTLVLHRSHGRDPSRYHFSCYTYKRRGSDACTSHYIRECILDDVVLEDLRRVTSMAREHTKEFAEYIGSRQSAEIQREIRRLEKELAVMRKRSAELDAIFKKLYEDRVLDHISVEQFQMLSSGYTEEQAALAKGIGEKESAIQKLKESVSNTDRFIAKAKRYTDITELTPELLRLFIQKIVVHEKSVKYSKHAEQTIEIHYTDIGYIGGETRQSKESSRQEISA